MPIIDTDTHWILQPQSKHDHRLGLAEHLQQTRIFPRRIEIPVSAPVKSPPNKRRMKSQRHFVVTHSHRHGVTPGLIIAQKGGEKPGPAEAIKLLRMDVEPGREEFVEVIEVSPVFLSKSRSAQAAS